MRRRGLRQNRGGPAGGDEVHHGRQAGRHSGAHHRSGPAALCHGGEPLPLLPGEHRGAVPVPDPGPGAGHPGPDPGGKGGPADRHPQAIAEGPAVSRPGPAGHRRGAALRRDPQGKAPGAGPAGGHPDPVRHPHSPDSEYGPVRHPGHEHHRGAAPRPPAGADLCDGARVARHCRGHPPGAEPGRPGILPAQPGGEHRVHRRTPAAVAGGGCGHRHCPRQNGRAGAELRHAADGRRRDPGAGVHHHHRDRHRYPQRQHPDHRGCGPAGPVPAAPDPGPHRALLPPGLRLSHLPPRQGADGGGQQAAVRHPGIRGLRRRLPHRHAGSGDPGRR